MGLVDYMEAARLLNKYGINTIESKYVKSAAEAVKFAGNEQIVMKVLSEKALHKTKAGVVKLGLSGEKQITDAFNELYRKAAELKPYNIIVQKMAKPGNEIIIGGREDPQFGKIIMIGIGGIYVEAFKDVAIRICPIKRYDANEMLNQLKSKQIVTQNGKATEMVVNLLLKVDKLLTENNISELDLNPVIVREGDYSVVDIRMLK
ncbi:MAG: acetate--CoA ligase family protein [Candidatus Micrarchaeia archaeon]